MIQVQNQIRCQHIVAMAKELEVLINAAARAAWDKEPSRRLADAIEKHIVLPLPLWLKTSLGRDEASQLARGLPGLCRHGWACVHRPGLVSAEVVDGGA